MRIFQEEIFGPVVSVTKFIDYDDAIKTANDTLYGLGAGVWSRNGDTAYRAGRTIQAGRVWTNCYHAYPAHAAFGGYKQSGHRPREPQDDARPLPADEEPAGELLAERARLLLTSRDGLTRRGTIGTQRVIRQGERRRKWSCTSGVTDGAAAMLRQLTGQHGPLMFHQSGGCCDGSSPMCYPDG